MTEKEFDEMFGLSPKDWEAVNTGTPTEIPTQSILERLDEILKEVTDERRNDQ